MIHSHEKWGPIDHTPTGCESRDKTSRQGIFTRHSQG
jgi:hypothetical protein